MTAIQTAIIKTLAYADIFNYPLTLSEIHRWLIHSRSISFNQLSSNLSYQLIFSANSYFHLPNRQQLVKLRQQRLRFSQLKLTQAQKASDYLKLIPFIKLIAITGALAMNNSKKNDDIDFIIISSPNRLWLTRLLAILILELLRLRRRPRSAFSPDKICLNLFLTQSHLTLPSAQRNLYTAHELCQLRPLYNQDSTYQKLLLANPWVKKYLPHATCHLDLTINHQPRSQPSAPGSFFETLAFKLQYLYMKPKITNEQVSKNYAFFHPRPTSKTVLNQYQQKLKQLGLT